MLQALPITHSAAAVSQRSCTVCGVLSELQLLDIRPYERTNTATLLARLVPKASHWLQRAQELVVNLAARYAANDDADGAKDSMSFELRVDSLLVSRDASRRLVGDIAFVAGLELSQRAAQLRSLGARTSEAEVLSQVDSAIRRIIKSLSALEHAIARAENREPGIAYDSELAVSLRVRAAYARLRRGVSGKDALTMLDHTNVVEPARWRDVVTRLHDGQCGGTSPA